MWIFRRKKVNPESSESSPLCSYCQSRHTRVIAYHGSDRPDYVRIWRGQRYITCKCLDCGQDFYIEEPPDGLADRLIEEDTMIEDEEELQAAEDELKRQNEEDGDHRC
jgi:hypothetical protein